MIPASTFNEIMEHFAYWDEKLDEHMLDSRARWQQKYLITDLAHYDKLLTLDELYYSEHFLLGP